MTHMEGWQVENCVIYICTTAAILGLYAMSGSWHSLWPMSMLLCANTVRVKI